MLLFWGALSDLSIWGENTYTHKMDASLLPAGARAGLSVSLSGGATPFAISRLRYVGGPQDVTWDFDYSPDGKFLVMAGTGYTEGVLLFNAENLQRTNQGAHYELIHSVTFSPDGRTIVGGTLNGRVLQIDTTNLNVSPLEHPVYGQYHLNVPIAWLSPDRSLLAMERGDIHTSVLHWSDLRGNATQTVRHQKKTNDGFPVIMSVGFDASASTLASANQEGIIHLWNIGNGRHLQKFTQYRTDFDEDYCDTGVYEVNAGENYGGREYWRSDDPDISNPPSPDRHILIAAHDHWYDGGRETYEDLKKVIHLYETTYTFKTGNNTVCGPDWAFIEQPVKRFRGHKDTIWNVVYGEDGREIASASYDNTIRLWDVKRGYEKKVFRSHTLRFSNITLGRGGRCWRLGASTGLSECGWGIGGGNRLKHTQGLSRVWHSIRSGNPTEQISEHAPVRVLARSTLRILMETCS